jgi:serine phosphatase RsbU (regulator of sigma subunit)
LSTTIIHTISIIALLLFWLVSLYLVYFFVNRKTKQYREKLVNKFKRIGKENKKLNNDYKLMSLTADGTDNLVAITNHKGILIYINNAFKEVLAIPSGSEIIGSQLFEFEGLDKIYDIFLDSTERSQNAKSEVFLTNRRGHRYWLQLNFSHSLLNDEHFVVIMATNINDLKYAEEEISQQREELMVQGEQLEAMNTELENINQLTTDSITYAQRIQYALLPRKDDYSKFLKDSFLLFKPRDIVSGDFYWYGEVDDKAFFVEADCTGHGVPGALMATIGNTLLNEIIISERIFNPAIILKELDRKIRIVLRQDNKIGSQQDGMDMSVAQYDLETRQLSISLANQFAFMFHKGELVEVPGSLHAIGGDMLDRMTPTFDLHRYDINDGDVLYFFSDGYRDQYNEDESEKMMQSRFKNAIEKICKLDMENQYQYLIENFDSWRGGTRQIDDVIIWGLMF